MAQSDRTGRLAFPALLCALLAAILAFGGCAARHDPTRDAASGSQAQSAEGSDDGIVPARRLPGAPAERIDPEAVEGSDAADSEGNDPTGELVARFLDVGQGDSALVTCDGRSLLIDGGPASASSKLYAVLERLGIDHLDYVIATHPDADHIGGIPGALSRASAGRVLCSTDRADTARFEEFERVVRQGGGVIEVPSVGTTLPLGGATVEIVGPVVHFGDDNDDSLVVRVTYGSTAMLFMGDAEMSAEQALLDEGVDVRADVLKVGHHGSDTSSSAFFVQEVDPAFAVISVGRNSYGHPAPAVLDMLSAMGVETLRTDRLGDITIVSNGHDVSLQGG